MLSTQGKLMVHLRKGLKYVPLRCTEVENQRASYIQFEALSSIVWRHGNLQQFTLHICGPRRAPGVPRCRNRIPSYYLLGGHFTFSDFPLAGVRDFRADLMSSA